MKNRTWKIIVQKSSASVWYYKIESPYTTQIYSSQSASSYRIARDVTTEIMKNPLYLFTDTIEVFIYGSDWYKSKDRITKSYKILPLDMKKELSKC